jgi:hypothetical protein
MEIGHFQLQLIVSALVIVGVAFVALICDFLKRNNEQLREMNIELKIRREEEQKRLQVAMQRPAETVERIEAPKLEVAVAAPRAVATTARERAHAVGNKDASNKEKKRAVNAQALAAMERGATLASAGGRPRQAAAVAPKPEVIQPEIVKPAAKTTIKKDWNSLLNRIAPKIPVPAGQDLLAAVVAATHSSSKTDTASLPAGFQEGFVLNKLVQSRQPITGLVVSIGVNASRNADGSLPESIHELVQSLIGPDDFAAQSGEDEFLLIYPQERGASAQRRLSQIAQRLWDFQLRSLGSFQILFSWGGVEVRSESIEEAIASASERMQETKRGRKLLTMASQVEFRQAV